jgi:hypothetical protein
MRWIILLLIVLSPIAQSLKIKPSDFDDILKPVASEDDIPSFVLSDWEAPADSDKSESIKTEKSLPRPNLKTKIQVQSVLAEGLGWKKDTLGEETATHVIITVTGVHPETQTTIPFANARLWIKLDGTDSTPCVVEEGKGDGRFSRCDLGPKPFRFWTNHIGRVSFSLPLSGMFLKHRSGSIAFPALLIRTDFMKEGTWYEYLYFNSKNQLS